MIHRRLLLGTGLLSAVQLAHLLDVLRYSDTATFPAVLADPIGMTGISLAVAAFAASALQRPSGTTLALVAGAGIAAGFTLYHGLPVRLGINNPYWTIDGNHADLLQWATVLGAIAIGLRIAVIALSAGATERTTPNSRSRHDVRLPPDDSSSRHS